VLRAGRQYDDRQNFGELFAGPDDLDPVHDNADIFDPSALMRGQFGNPVLQLPIVGRAIVGGIDRGDIIGGPSENRVPDRKGNVPLRVVGKLLRVVDASAGEQFGRRGGVEIEQDRLCALERRDPRTVDSATQDRVHGLEGRFRFRECDARGKGPSRSNGSVGKLIRATPPNIRRT
jgi:hypothetical protein